MVLFANFVIFHGPFNKIEHSEAINLTQYLFSSALKNQSNPIQPNSIQNMFSLMQKLLDQQCNSCGKSIIPHNACPSQCFPIHTKKHQPVQNLRLFLLYSLEIFMLLMYLI